MFNFLEVIRSIFFYIVWNDHSPVFVLLSGGHVLSFLYLYSFFRAKLRRNRRWRVHNEPYARNARLPVNSSYNSYYFCHYENRSFISS
jgi:hypothetical protein